MTDWSKVGKSSRNKGNAFERRCREVMAGFTGHPDWMRSPPGHHQKCGDIVPHEDDEPCDIWIGTGPSDPEGVWDKVYVECKYRAAISSKNIQEWLEDVKRKAGRKPYALLFGQPRGPVFILPSDDFPRDPETEGEYAGVCVHVGSPGASGGRTGKK